MSKRIIYSLLGFITLVFFIVMFSNSDEKTDEFSKKVKISLREVGNQLLLSNGDSTSLILPVKELDHSQYELSFQSHLLFSPDSLVTIIRRNLGKTDLSQNYRVEVIQCEDKEVAYSYEMNIDTEKTIIPCAGRVLPQRCYTVQFEFLDKKEGWLNKQIFLYVFIFLVFLLLQFFLHKRKSPKEPIDKNQNYSSIGRFHFYPEQNKLVKEAIEIALSNKECELLEILVANPNQVLKREDLMKRVWEDNGVFVGRSLDTYISKLRKKLQDDDSIKITNVHGVGYKLEISR